MLENLHRTKQMGVESRALLEAGDLERYSRADARALAEQARALAGHGQREHRPAVHARAPQRRRRRQARRRGRRRVPARLRPAARRHAPGDARRGRAGAALRLRLPGRDRRGAAREGRDRRLRPDRPQAGGGARPRRRARRATTYDPAQTFAAGACEQPLDALLGATSRTWSSSPPPTTSSPRLSIAALEAGAHVLVEKPARDRQRADRGRARPRPSAPAGCVKVGFNHRFHPGLMRARRGGALRRARRDPAPAGALRPRRPARLRARVARRPARSGGGELIDQGMHLLDLSHWLLGPLPLHSALLRTAFWDMPVEDNAVVAARRARRRAVGARCTCPGRSGRTCSRSRSTAARRSCRSTAWCAPTARSASRAT